mmetsp:Transcript_5211/g.19455  ORF Transcript_5211/g.19455 Transcript_5211/m.19455 type:complete len:345 (-) Transcript_5211:1032-2066(-)
MQGLLQTPGGQRLGGAGQLGHRAQHIALQHPQDQHQRQGQRQAAAPDRAPDLGLSGLQQRRRAHADGQLGDLAAIAVDGPGLRQHELAVAAVAGSLLGQERRRRRELHHLDGHEARVVHLRLDHRVGQVGRDLPDRLGQRQRHHLGGAREVALEVLHRRGAGLLAVVEQHRGGRQQQAEQQCQHHRRRQRTPPQAEHAAQGGLGLERWRCGWAFGHERATKGEPSVGPGFRSECTFGPVRDRVFPGAPRGRQPRGLAPQSAATEAPPPARGLEDDCEALGRPGGVVRRELGVDGERVRSGWRLAHRRRGGVHRPGRRPRAGERRGRQALFRFGQCARRHQGADA